MGYPGVTCCCAPRIHFTRPGTIAAVDAGGEPLRPALLWRHALSGEMEITFLHPAQGWPQSVTAKA